MAYVSHVTQRRLTEKHPVPQDGWMEEDDMIVSPQGTPRAGAGGGGAPSGPAGAGIVQCGEFLGGIRCMQVHKRATSAGVGAISVWTGEQDGALGVRNGQGQGMFTLEKKKTFFVTSLLCAGSEHFPSKYMYAGMSDGSIRIYEQCGADAGREGGDYRMLREVKRHSASVTCMISVRQYVVSGGSDWWMFLWEWTGGTPYGGGQFAVVKDKVSDTGSARGGSRGGYAGGKISLHRNTVRCLAHDQANGMLYTGGDDSAIFVIPWHRSGLNTAAAREVGGRLPKLLHRGGVRALVVYECYLFSASEDGSVKVWSAVTEDGKGGISGGQHVRTLLRSDGPVRCLLKDPAGGRIWVGGADGVLRVFSAHDHQLVTEIHRPHHGAVITGLHAIGRVDAHRWWVASREGLVQIAYIESEAPESDSLQGMDRELELSAEVDRLRKVTIGNYGELDLRKSRCARIQHIDRERKAKALSILNLCGHSGVKRTYLKKLLKWHHDHRSALRRRRFAELLALTTDKGMAQLYLRKWRLWIAARKRLQVANRFSEALLVQGTAGLQVLYFAKLREYARRDYNRRRRQDVANRMLRHNTSGIMRSIFMPWMDSHRTRFKLMKKKLISGMLLRQSDRGLQMVYWHRLTEFLAREQKLALKKKLIGAMGIFTDDGLRRLFWGRLLTWHRRLSRRKKLSAFAHVMMAGTADGLRRVYLGKIVAHTKVHRVMPSLNAEFDRLGKEIADLAELLTGDNMTDEEIAAEMAELEDDCHTLTDDKQRISRSTEAQARDNATTRAELRAPEHNEIDLHVAGLSPLDAALTVLRRMSVVAIRCRGDLDTIHDCHNERKKISPAKLLKDGFKDLKEGIRRFLEHDGVSPEEAFARLPWELPGGWEHRMDHRTMHGLCHRGLKQMVIASHRLRNHYDYCTDPKIDQKRYERYQEQVKVITATPGLLEELNGNYAVLVSVAFKVSYDRELKENEQWEHKRKEIAQAQEEAAELAESRRVGPALGDSVNLGGSVQRSSSQQRRPAPEGRLDESTSSRQAPAGGGRAAREQLGASTGSTRTPPSAPAAPAAEAQPARRGDPGSQGGAGRGRRTPSRPAAARAAGAGAGAGRGRIAGQAPAAAPAAPAARTTPRAAAAGAGRAAAAPAAGARAAPAPAAGAGGARGGTGGGARAGAGRARPRSPGASTR